MPGEFGELVPIGGGDPIPLRKDKLLIGRRESCDVVLRFANVSAHHCRLMVECGYWFVKDLDSRNGTKVNETRVTKKRIDPGDVLAIAKHKYEVQYDPVELGAAGPPPPDEDHLADIIGGRGLLDRAGLKRRKQAPVPREKSGDSDRQRYDVLSDAAGQIKIPKKKD